MIKNYPTLKKIVPIIFLVFSLTAFSQIAQRGIATTATSTNSSLTIPKPAGIAVGDIMLVNIAQGSDDRDTKPLDYVPTSAGWTLISSIYLDGRADRRGSVLFKIALAADVTAANYTFALDADNDSAVGAIVAFSGVDTSTPFDVTPGAINTNDSATVTATTITTVTANAAIVMLGQAVGGDRTWSGWSTATSPGALTELFDAQNGSGKESTIGGAWEIKATAGVTGNGTAILSGSERNGGILLALRPYTGPPTSPYIIKTPGTSTFTVPSCVTSITVEAWGGGGKGSTGTSDGEYAGGGGGAYARSVLTVVPGQTYDIFVGAGSTTTSAGGDSRFRLQPTGTDLVRAVGGQSVANNNNTGALGGLASASIGDVTFSGGRGANGSSNNYGGGGGSSGGTSSNGTYTASAQNRLGGTVAGGGSGGDGSTTDNASGNPGNGPGGGGSGVRRNNNTVVGGSGANGQVIITWTSTGSVTAYTVNGGGSYCAGGTGVAVGLANSQSGVNYQLYRGASIVGSAVSGTGAAISFGNQTVAGTYTVKATNGGCIRDMTGSAVVTVNPAVSAPTVGTITQPTCASATGSVILNGLPAGAWQLTRSPGGVVTTGTGASTTISGLSPGTYTYSVIGANNGTGLKGEYFNSTSPITNANNPTFPTTSPTLTRTDATVNFDWVNGNPGAPIGNDYFFVRWSGQIQPLYSQTYTFTTTSDDGVRLWVNGVQIINDWNIYPVKDNTGTISLIAGVKYDIVLEYYENAGQAVSKLSWSSASQANQIIPQSQLYPTAVCSSPASANVVINAQPSINTWNGSVSTDWNTASNWCVGVPTIGLPNTLDVVIPSGLTNYPIISSGAVAGYVNTILLEINTTLNVRENSLRITDNLTLNGKIDLEGESQLLQDTGSTLDAASTGSIEIDQQGEGNKYRYNYWSMPVYTDTDGIMGKHTTIFASLKNGTIPSSPAPITFNNSGYDGATSPFTLSTYWMYKYANSGGGYSAWDQVRSTGKVYAGQGFTMKGPGAPGSPAQNYVFVGKPNNGIIELTVAKNNDYLVGNPYPSALDAYQFLDDNSPTGTASITGTIYFWEHYGGNTHNLAGYQAGYATLTKSGGVQASAFPGLGGGISVKGAPKRDIPVGQAFFVVGEAVNGGQIQFNNGQRVFVKEGATSIFMKSSNTKSKTENTRGADLRPKFRIGFDAPKISHRQLLLTIDERATPAVDWGYDAEIYEVFVDDMYWMLNNKKYVIQATNEVGLNSEVPLGIQLSKTGMVTVKIDALENVDDDISVYLKDKLTGETFNMRDKPVQLNLTAGKYADRFVLVFKTQKLVAEDVVAEVLIPAAAQPIIEGMHVFMNNAIGELQIKNNSTEEIVSVALVNTLGQTIKTWNSNFNIRTISLPLSTATGVYIVQINTKTGKTVKKISVE
jgi:hypothetical protein